MNRTLIMRRIVLPQAMRIIIPPTGNETIGMLKTTSLVTAVPFTLELQFAHQRHRQPYLQADSAASRGLLLVPADHLHSDGCAVPP